MVERCLKESTWVEQSDGAPRGFEWESNSKHVEDMVGLCGLKLDSKGAPTPLTKATTGKGRRDIDDALDTTDAQTCSQAAGTGLYMSLDRPSLQFADVPW